MLGADVGVVVAIRSDVADVVGSVDVAGVVGVLRAAVVGWVGIGVVVVGVVMVDVDDSICVVVGCIGGIACC